MRESFILAWRNIWRNPRRTLITAGAIGLGLASMLVTASLWNGMDVHMVRAATESFLGHAELHAKGFRKTHDTEIMIPDADAVLKRVRAMPGVADATARIFGSGLASIGDRSEAVEVIGADPVNEPKITDWQDRLLEGTYIEKSGDAIIGKPLAKKLEVEVGSKLVLSVADIHTGDLNYALLHVRGIVFTNNIRVDKTSVIIPLEDARRLLGTGPAVHEITIRAADTVDVEDPAAISAILAPITDDALDAAPWHELAPVVARIMNIEGFLLVLFVLVIFFVIALGIVNTLSMSVLERTHEFGIMRAVGTTGGRLVALVFFEATCLGVVGALMGLILFLPAHLILATVGINMGGVEFAGVTLDSVVYSVLDPYSLSGLPPLFVVLTAAVALTSAVRAARIQPVEALRQV